MSRLARRIFFLVISAGLCFLCTACGAPRTVIAKVRLTKDGNPYQGTIKEVTATLNRQTVQKVDRGSIEITFVPANDEPNNAYQANLGKDGTFEVLGRQGRGIPAGGYKIRVRELVPPKIRKSGQLYDFAVTRELSDKEPVQIFDIDVDKQQ